MCLLCFPFLFLSFTFANIKLNCKCSICLTKLDLIMIAPPSKIQIEVKRRTAEQQTARERRAWSAGNGHATSDSHKMLAVISTRVWY